MLAGVVDETLYERDGGPLDLRRHFAALRYDGGFAYDCISGASGVSCLAG
jgi:hypothetical protein